MELQILYLENCVENEMKQWTDMYKERAERMSSYPLCTRHPSYKTFIGLSSGRQWCFC